MKCFWCIRLSEVGKLEYVKIKDAQVVHGGTSMCLGHLDVIRHFGADALLTQGLMSR